MWLAWCTDGHVLPQSLSQQGRDRPRTLEAAGGMPGSNAQSRCRASPQNSSFSTLAGKAFTTVLAGLALTRTVLPNISRVPALVAGFLRVLIVTRSPMCSALVPLL